MNGLKNRGFTLVELMVVVVIIGILSTVVYANFGSSRAQARDTQRKADLRNLQIAIEQYKLKNGRYPAMGTATSTGPCSDSNGDGFSSETDKGGICRNTYIEGLIEGGFINALPHDKYLNNNEGYSYKTNDSGTVYKVMALNTAEIHQDYSTDASLQVLDMRAYDIRKSSGSGSINREVVGWCRQLLEGGSIPQDFFGNNLRPSFSKSYGIWGGFEAKGNQDLGCVIQPNCKPAAVQKTTDVICQ